MNFLRNLVNTICQTAKINHNARNGCTWRIDAKFGANPATVYPNYIPHVTHQKHYRPPHTWGISAITRLRVVDNSKLGREAMAEGRPPKVIQVYSWKYGKRPHGAWAKLGDRVLMAIKGLKKQGIVVGLKQRPLPGLPKYDTNNVVLIEENGNPMGTRITAPIPNCIRPILVSKTFPKKPDYTKILAIATRFV